MELCPRIQRVPYPTAAYSSAPIEVDSLTPDPEQLRAFAEDYTAAWCSMDPEAVAAHYAPEARSRSTADRPPWAATPWRQSPPAFRSPARHAGLRPRSSRGWGSERVPLHLHRERIRAQAVPATQCGWTASSRGRSTRTGSSPPRSRAWTPRSTRASWPRVYRQCWPHLPHRV